MFEWLYDFFIWLFVYFLQALVYYYYITLLFSLDVAQSIMMQLELSSYISIYSTRLSQVDSRIWNVVSFCRLPEMLNLLLTVVIWRFSWSFFK